MNPVLSSLPGSLGQWTPPVPRKGHGGRNDGKTVRSDAADNLWQVRRG